MSSKSKASDPREPLISMRIAFLRPHAKRVASNVPMAPPATRAMNTAASSTVTGPRSAPAEPCRPENSLATGRSCTKVSSRPLTPVIRSPVMNWVRSTMCAPLSWRLDREVAGSGSLGDIGAHIVDLTQFITGDRITGVSGLLETFVHERPVASEFSGLHGSAGAERGPVTVDDAAVFMARFAGGAIGTFEATRFAWGRKNAIRIEINGSRGSLAFDFEDMNVLHYFDATEGSRLGLRHGVGERLLAQHVLTGRERRDGDLRMCVDGRAHVEQVDVVTLEQTAPVRLPARPAQPGRRFLDSGPVAAADRRHLGSPHGSSPSPCVPR